MLRTLGVESQLSADPSELSRSDSIILPGVGAFDEGMARLRAAGLVDVLKRLVIDAHKPVLGICLGMQLFGRSSEEGLSPGLGWIAAETKRFRFSNSATNLRVPHMGWNTVDHDGRPPLFQNMESPARFYFVHSYHVVCDAPEDVVATAEHGLVFTAAITRGNITGVQFHPEKSHRFGMCVLRNFLLNVVMNQTPEHATA
jgi:imidazole glycerol-phosphate synthase subunit HisH